MINPEIEHKKRLLFDALELKGHSLKQRSNQANEQIIQ